MNTPSASPHDQLAAAGRQRDRAARWATFLTVAGLAALMLLLAAVLDYGLTLPAPVRWAALSVIGASLIVGGVRLARLWRRPTSLKQAALEVEAAKPEAGCEVSTAAEYLTGERKVAQEFEHELVAALQQRAATVVSQTPLPQRRRLVLPALTVLGGLTALAVFVAVYPAAGTALKRTAAPWTKAAFSQVEVTPGAAEVAVGKPFEITSRFRGRPPESAELQVREDGRNDWTTVPLAATTNGTFTHTLPAVAGSFTYRVTGSDAVSDEFAVTAYVPPEVKDLRVRLEPPAYTRLKPLEQVSADITIVRGSRAEFHVTPTVPLAKAQLRFTNGVTVELKAAADRPWTAQLPVGQDTAYRFELFDTHGRKGGDETLHHITAVPDAPPKVDFTTPGGDIRAAATNRIALKLTASDDFGVADLKIVYHRLGSPERELVVEPKVTKGNEVEAEAELNLASLELREFELVAYHAEARDFNSLDGPGIGRSPTYFIEITDLEGGKCLSQSQGQKVNLLVIQKQIIADTTALAQNPAADSFKDLAARQKDAIEFGKMYQQALTQTGAPLDAQGAMNSAVAAMEKAAVALAAKNRDTALPPEESALAGLYQVLRLMPQLQNLPTDPAPVAKAEPPPPPAVKVVLEAIKKQKKEPPNQQELARVLEQVRQLSRQQAGLSTACQNPGSSPGGGPAQVSRPSPAGQAPGEGAKPGEGSKPGEGTKPGEGAKPGPGSPKPDAKELAQLAPKQEALSQEAKEIAERIARLTGKGSRLGHGAGQRMNAAAAKMSQAAQAMRSGKGETAGTAGDESSASLGAATAMLENLLSGRPELSDVAAEDAP